MTDLIPLAFNAHQQARGYVRHAGPHIELYNRDRKLLGLFDSVASAQTYLFSSDDPPCLLPLGYSPLK
jgi:hypothetical protein